jgi:hypothetical protein
MLCLIEAQQEICEANDGARAFIAASQNGLWESMIRPVGEGIAVDDE